MSAKAKLAGFALAAAHLSVAFGASLHIAPVSIQMTPGQSAAVVTLRNDGDKPLHAQVRVFGWSQEQNQDHLTATQVLSASPPMIEVAPQASQTIRLVRAAGPRSPHEESFRVLIDEIVDRAAVSDTGVSVQLRYSVPVFLSNAGMKPPRMTVTPTLKNQTLTLRAQNGGGQHASVSAVTLENAAGQSVVVEPGLVGYVLVGQTMEWNMQVPAADSAKGPFVTLRCRFNGEAFSTKL
jgi:fimbrial chaperone protein